MVIKELGRWNDGGIIKEEEEEEDDEAHCSISIESSSQDPIGSCSSTFSSSDLMEDASSSSVSSLNGSLYDLSDLMTQLPIKRGLSKFYEGKSQSFTSLASVENVLDLPKKGCVNFNYIKRKKLCRSHGGGLDHTQNRAYSPKATITKKGTRISSTFSKR